MPSGRKRTDGKWGMEPVWRRNNDQIDITADKDLVKGFKDPSRRMLARSVSGAAPIGRGHGTQLQPVAGVNEWGMKDRPARP